jgi:uncharacterized protein (TIGR02118 family)
MAQMIVIYKTPKNPAAFDRHYFEFHAPLARQLPRLRRYQVSRGPIISLYGAVEAHFVSSLQFDSLSDINSAFMSECGRACAADRQQLVPHANDVQRFLFDTLNLNRADEFHLPGRFYTAGKTS